MNPDAQLIANLRRRLTNARRRALYWSGNPTFTGKRFSPQHANKTAWGVAGQYELAMADIESLCARLEGLTGRSFKRSDPKAAFQTRFLNIMSKLNEEE